MAEVSGFVDIEELASYIRQACKGKQFKLGLELINLEALPTKDPLSRLKANGELNSKGLGNSDCSNVL